MLQMIGAGTVGLAVKLVQGLGRLQNMDPG